MILKGLVGLREGSSERRNVQTLARVRTESSECLNVARFERRRAADGGVLKRNPESSERLKIGTSRRRREGGGPSGWSRGWARTIKRQGSRKSNACQG